MRCLPLQSFSLVLYRLHCSLPVIFALHMTATPRYQQAALTVKTEPVLLQLALALFGMRANLQCFRVAFAFPQLLKAAA